MEKYLIITGLLFNSAVISFNRLIRELPHWLYCACLILGIALMIIGVVLSR